MCGELLYLSSRKPSRFCDGDGNCLDHIVYAKMLIFVYKKFQASSVCGGKILQYRAEPYRAWQAEFAKDELSFGSNVKRS